MQPQEKHAMVITETYPSGAEEWYCPTCGYRFIMQWPPQFKKITLEEGNPVAIHSGGTGGLQMDTSEVKASDPSTPQSIENADQVGPIDLDEDTLDPWLNFLQGFDVSGELDRDESDAAGQE